MDIKIPSVIALETQSKCNGRCTICPYDKVEIKHGRMPMWKIKKIINECEDVGIPEVSLFGNNEPLIDDRIVEIMEYASIKNFKINIDTNMGIMTPAIAYAITKYTDAFNISFHCNTFDDHHKYMPGIDHEKSLENIKLFYSIYKRYKKRTRVTVYNMVCEGIINKLRLMLYWGKYGFLTNFRRYDSRASNVFDVPSNDASKCDYGNIPNKYMHIAYNGDVLLCCNDWQRKFVMGNIRDGLLEVWNNKNFEKARRIASNRQKAPEGYLCRKCEFGWS